MQTQSLSPMLSLWERVSMTISRKDGTIQSVARLKVTVRVKLSLYSAVEPPKLVVDYKNKHFKSDFEF